jgi:ABC-type cobalamin transport system permease subunit
VIGTAFAIADSVMLSVCDEGLPPQVTSYNGSAGHVIALILLMHGLAMKWRADNDAY